MQGKGGRLEGEGGWRRKGGVVEGKEGNEGEMKGP